MCLNVKEKALSLTVSDLAHFTIAFRFHISIHECFYFILKERFLCFVMSFLTRRLKLLGRISNLCVK